MAAIDTYTEMELVGTSGELRQILSNVITNSMDACNA